MIKQGIIILIDSHHIFHILSILDIEYVYKYETKIFQKSGGGSEGVHNSKIDETLYNFASDSLHTDGVVKVAKIWTGKKKSLIRFRVRPFSANVVVTIAFSINP